MAALPCWQILKTRTIRIFLMLVSSHHQVMPIICTFATTKLLRAPRIVRFLKQMPLLWLICLLVFFQSPLISKNSVWCMRALRKMWGRQAWLLPLFAKTLSGMMLCLQRLPCLSGKRRPMRNRFTTRLRAMAFIFAAKCSSGLNRLVA